MKHILLAALFTFSALASADTDERLGMRGPHSASVTGGFNTGGFTLGVEYEYLFENSMGIGGFFREFPKDSKHDANGLTIIGAQVGQHFYKKNWDLTIAPGFAIINVQQSQPKPAPDSATTLGPSFAISLLHQLNSSVAIGFEVANYWVWFGSDYQGKVRDDMSFKVRASF